MRKEIWKGWKGIAIIFLMMFSIAGLALADGQNSDNSGRQKTQPEGQAMDARYAHLVCGTTFTITQINEIVKYVPKASNISSDSDKLTADMNSLAAIKNDSTKTVSDFSAFVTTTLNADMQQATSDIRNVKKNLHSYNLTNDTISSYRQDFLAAQQAYKSCQSSTDVEHGNVVLNTYKGAEANWEKTIQNMGNKNLSTTDVSSVDQEMKNAIQQLQTAIDSGNGTMVQDIVKQINEDNLHLWARFEIARVNSYIDKVGPLADQYNMSDNITGLKQNFGDIANLVAPGHQYQNDDFNNVWSTIKDASKSLQQVSKDVLAERRQQMQEQRQAMMQNRTRIGGNGTRFNGTREGPMRRNQTPPNNQGENTPETNETGGQ